MCFHDPWLEEEEGLTEFFAAAERRGGEKRE